MFIVVISTLVVNTVISKGPIIFMKLAQKDSGEIDAIYVAGPGRNSNQNTYSEQEWYSLNYTAATAALDQNDITYNMAPRYQLCPQGDSIQFVDNVGTELLPNGTTCFKFFDSE